METTRDAVSKEHALPLSQKRSAMVNSLMKFILWFRHFGHFPRGRVLHPFFVDIPKIRRKKKPFFPRTPSLWNSLPSECFPASYNLHLFKSRVNKRLSSKLSAM